MRILVTGASGFIGRTCLRELSRHEIAGTFRSRPRPGLVHLDLLDPDEIRALLESLRPDAVIHCAARPSVDWCEENPAEARRLNLDTTRRLLDECDRIEVRLAFLSTDYVFDGKSGPYDETATTNPINEYGRIKLEAERALLSSRGRHLVVRTTNVYGYDRESKNYLMAILPQVARGEPVRVAADQLGTPTLVTDLCRTIGGLLEGPESGVVHLAGPETMDRVEWGRRAARMFGLDPTLITGAATSNLGQPAPRPLRAGLVCRRLGSSESQGMSTLAEGLAQMKRDWEGAGCPAW